MWRRLVTKRAFVIPVLLAAAVGVDCGQQLSHGQVCLLQQSYRSSQASQQVRLLGDPVDEGGHTDGIAVPPNIGDRDIQEELEKAQFNPHPDKSPSDSTESSYKRHSAGFAVATDRVPLRLELHLTKELSMIHKSAQGPLPRFVEDLQAEVCKALGLPRQRLLFLSIRGELLRLNSTSLRQDPISKLLNNTTIDRRLGLIDKSWTISKSRVNQPAWTGMAELAPLDDRNIANRRREALYKRFKLTQEGTTELPTLTIVDFELLQSLNQDPDDTPSANYVDLWRRQLTDRSSTLMSGSFGDMLQGASVLVVSPDFEKDTTLYGVRHGAARRGSSLNFAVVRAILLIMLSAAAGDRYP